MSNINRENVCAGGGMSPDGRFFDRGRCPVCGRRDIRVSTETGRLWVHSKAVK